MYHGGLGDLSQAASLDFALAGYMGSVTYIISFGAAICVKYFHD